MTSPSRLPARGAAALALVLTCMFALAACGGGEESTSDVATDVVEGETTDDVSDDGAATTVPADNGAAAVAGPLNSAALEDNLGPTDDVSAVVASLLSFPALATASGAEVVAFTGRTTDNGSRITDSVLLRYITDHDPNEIATFFEQATAELGWIAMPSDDTSYGGSSSLFTGLYDRPDVDLGPDEPDVEVAVEPMDDGLAEVILIVTQPAADEPWSRYDELLEELAIPEESTGLVEFSYSISVDAGGVYAARQATLDYEVDVASLQESVVALVGEPVSVTPVEPGPGMVEAEAFSGFDFVRYESWLGSDLGSSSASRLEISADRIAG